MIQCAVIRCPQRSANRYTVQQQPRTTVSLCSDHRAAISRGEPWLYDPTDRSMLMGADMPPVVIGVEQITNSGSMTSGGGVVRLRLETDSGFPVELVVTEAA